MWEKRGLKTRVAFLVSCVVFPWVLDVFDGILMGCGCVLLFGCFRVAGVCRPNFTLLRSVSIGALFVSFIVRKLYRAVGEMIWGEVGWFTFRYVVWESTNEVLKSALVCNGGFCMCRTFTKYFPKHFQSIVTNWTATHHNVFRYNMLKNRK